MKSCKISSWTNPRHFSNLWWNFVLQLMKLSGARTKTQFDARTEYFFMKRNLPILKIWAILNKIWFYKIRYLKARQETAPYCSLSSVPVRNHLMTWFESNTNTWPLWVPIPIIVVAAIQVGWPRCNIISLFIISTFNSLLVFSWTRPRVLIFTNVLNFFCIFKCPWGKIDENN